MPGSGEASVINQNANDNGTARTTPGPGVRSGAGSATVSSRLAVAGDITVTMTVGMHTGEERTD